MEEQSVEKKRQQECRTVEEIIRLYCRGHHHERQGKMLCPECQELADYALARIRHCPRMAEKTFCSVCPIHCYAPEKRRQILCVMRYGGWRMLFYHPVMALHHMLLSWKWHRKHG